MTIKEIQSLTFDQKAKLTPDQLKDIEAKHGKAGLKAALGENPTISLTGGEKVAQTSPEEGSAGNQAGQGGSAVHTNSI